MNFKSNKFPISLILFGIVIIIFAFLADFLGIGGQSGFGVRQTLLAVFGLILILLGIFIASSIGKTKFGQLIDFISNYEKPIYSSFKQQSIGILIIASWFGLITGLLEGLALRILDEFRWLAGNFVFLGSSLEIIWISPIFNLVLFCFLGFVLIIIGYRFSRIPIRWLSVFLFSFLLCLDWILIPLEGRIATYASLLIAFGLAIEISNLYHKNEESISLLFKKSLPWLVGISLLGLIGIQGGLWLNEKIANARLPNAAPGSPNILVIVIDTLRADHLSSYGYERPTSPYLDQIAKGGVLFENAFSTSSWTPPSHASLLTGRYPYEHGADLAPLDDFYPTIGEALQVRGYRTGAFSANYDVFNRREGFDRGFHHFEDYYRSLSNIVTYTLYGRVIEQFVLHRGLGLEYKIDRKLASDVNRAVLSWIDQDQAKPFFAFLNYYDVHDPYIPPQPYRNIFSSLEKPGGLINTDWAMDIYVPMTPEQLQGEIDAYDGAIAYTDDQVNLLFNELKIRGLLANTIVVITSDHGESFGEHSLLEHHNSLYHEQIHVPLIFWWSEHLPVGQRVAAPVTIAALPATLLDLLNEEEQTSFPGPSLTQLWENPDLQPDWPYPMAEVAQVSWLPPQHLPHHGAMKSVVSPQWHYIEHEKFGPEIFNWIEDPDELINLITEQEMQPIINQFKNFLGSRNQ